MDEKKKRIGLGFLKNDWVITLSATLVGVFVAMYLNELVAKNNTTSQKNIATKNITLELAKNKEKIEKATKKHIELFDIIDLINRYAEEEGEHLIAPADSINNFKARHPDILMVEDSTLVSPGVYDYRGEINFDFALPQLEVTTIAWKTLENSGIGSAYNFECLMYLQGVYNLTDEIILKNKELLDDFIDNEMMTSKRDKLLRQLNILIDFEETLVEVYGHSEAEMKNCN